MVLTDSTAAQQAFIYDEKSYVFLRFLDLYAF